MRDVGLTLSTETSSGAAVVKVAGELDMATAPLFEAEVLPSLESERVVIDLTDCTFVDSSALRALLQTQRRVVDAGGKFAIIATSPATTRVLELATLDRFVPVAATLAEALTLVA
jgi:anti-sigma B factor antagonist